MGHVLAVDRKPEFCSFDIQLPAGRAAGVSIGASVAVNGTCLTVVRADGDVLRFDVIGETLRRTNLGALDAGSAVNYERSARVGDEIGGHHVSGHVHTTARVIDVQDTGDNRRIEFEVRAGGRSLPCAAWGARPHTGGLGSPSGYPLGASRAPRRPWSPPWSLKALPCSTHPAHALLQVGDPEWMRYILPQGPCPSCTPSIPPAGARPRVDAPPDG